jgi:NifU-like protein
MWDYTEKVKEHFFHPRNVGEIDDPDAEAEVGSIACGDALKLQLKIDEKGVITDAKFQTFGCGSAIASSSALTELIIGKSVEEAEQVTNRDIVKYLGGLPPQKMHCSVMGQEALEAALASWRGLDVAHEHEEGVIVCQCYGVTDKKIERVIKENNLQAVEEVTNYTKAGGGCTSCHPQIEEIIFRVHKQVVVKEAHAKKPPTKRLTNIQKINLIQEIIDQEVRPALQADGGDLELIDVEGDRVLVAMRGACVGCPSSVLTIKAGVEAKLREFVDEGLVVEEVRDQEVAS